MGKLSPKYQEIIWDVTEALQGEEQMENSISMVLDILVTNIGAENGFVWIYDNKENNLCIMACTGQNDVTGVTQGTEQGLVGYVYSKQDSIIIDDTVNDIRFSSDYDETCNIWMYTAYQ